jgi:hypothetical protein
MDVSSGKNLSHQLCTLQHWQDIIVTVMQQEREDSSCCKKIAAALAPARHPDS